VDKLQDLPHVWRACLELALEGYNAGSLGIAAVITDKANRIIAWGRNQLSDNLDSCSSIRMSSVAHAEINALHNLPQAYQGNRELTLYTTVEPCPMCLGAVAMSRVRSIKVGCADPHAGATNLLTQNDYLRRKRIAVSFEGGAVEKLCFVLHYVSIKGRLGHNPHHPILVKIKKRYPHYVHTIDAYVESSSIFSPGRLTYDSLHSVLARMS
jgi:tRNA(Arg) A34 adenosine deaminase TadA